MLFFSFPLASSLKCHQDDSGTATVCPSDKNVGCGLTRDMTSGEIGGRCLDQGDVTQTLNGTEMPACVIKQPANLTDQVYVCSTDGCNGPDEARAACQALGIERLNLNLM